jgi:hypothetical protein
VHSSENCRRTIAVVNVAVNRHSGANLAVALHAANRNRHVVNHAEAFAVIGKGVVKSAADVYRNAIF